MTGVLLRIYCSTESIENQGFNIKNPVELKNEGIFIKKTAPDTRESASVRYICNIPLAWVVRFGIPTQYAGYRQRRYANPATFVAG